MRSFELDVSLRYADPAPRRRIQLPAEATFLDLHRAIQLACDWDDYHLWRFMDRHGEAVAGIPDDSFGEPDPDASSVKLSSFFPRRRVCVYLYDFGDSWQHEVRLSDTFEADTAFQRRLVDGELAFPPEDCGGIWGYEECLRIVRDGPQDERDEDRLEWLGDDWDPDAFDLAAVKARVDA